METMVSGGAGYSERLNNLQRVSRVNEKIIPVFISITVMPIRK